MASYCQGRCTDDPTDHAGHIIGHRFVQDQGLQNLFPQNAKLNTGAYKTLENELADWINFGATIEINYRLSDVISGRPSKIGVYYEVKSQEGKILYDNQIEFANSPSQSFTRVSKLDIESMMAHRNSN